MDVQEKKRTGLAPSVFNLRAKQLDKRPGYVPMKLDTAL